MFHVAALAEFDFRSEEYAALFGRSAATPFQHPIWLSALYGRLVPAFGAEALIVTIRDATGKLVMVLPLVKRRYGVMRVVEFADLGVCDYVAPVCDPDDFAALAAQGSVKAAIRKALRPFDMIRISKMTEGAAPIERLFDIADRLPMETSTYAAPLVAPFERWAAGAMDPSYLKELTRKSRVLGRKVTVGFESSSEPERITAALEALREHRRDRYADAGGDLLDNPDIFAFYLQVALEGREGFIRTYTMTLDGVPSATVMGPTGPDGFLVVLVGSDISKFKNLSVGGQLFLEIARDCIGRGDTVYDFTIGDEPYKALFGATASPMWMALGSGSVIGAAAHTAITRLPWAQRLAKQVARRAGRAKGPRLPAAAE